MQIIDAGPRLLGRLAAALTFLALVMFTSGAAFAEDDFDFTDDSGDDGDGYDFTDDGGGDDGGGDGYDFTDDGGGDDGGGMDIPALPTGDKPIIVSFFDPVDSTPQRVVDRLDAALVNHLSEFEDYAAVSGLGIKAELDAMDSEARDSCVNDPPCVAKIASEMGIAKVIIARVRTEGLQRPLISLDNIDVTSAALENFIEFEASPRVKGQEKELRPAAYKLFNRSIPTDKAAGTLSTGGVAPVDTGIGTGQLIASIGSGVLGVALVGLGVSYGMTASDLETEIIDGRDNQTLNQVDAQSKLNEANDTAVLANVFYGLGGVAIAASVVLILIRPGDEIAKDQQYSGIDVYLEPVVSVDGAGVVGGFRF